MELSRHTDHLMLLYIPAMLSALLMVYLRVYESKKLSSIFQGYFDLRAFRRVIREETIVKGGVSNLLLVNTVLVLSTAITYLTYKQFNAPIDLSEIYWVFGITFVSLVVYYWSRKLLFVLIGFFSEQNFIAQEINTYNRFFYQVLGMCLLPLLFFLNYRLSIPQNTLLAFFFNGIILLLQTIIVLTYVIKIVQEFRQTTQINVSGYYLFLYFCTLEILPLIVTIYWFIGEN